MKQWLWWIIGIGAPVVIGVLLLYQYQAEWAGFYTPPNSPYANWKRLWDWLELLIIPAVLGFGIWWLNSQQRQSEQDIAKEREEERLLQNYFDIMKELLLEKDLRNSEEGSEVRSVARAWTITLLRNLDGARKGVVLRFLHEAHLIKKPAVVILEKADLSGADLSEAFLWGDDLSFTDLRQAKLNKAKLNMADLSGADLSEADLRCARLDSAILKGAKYDDATKWPEGFDPEKAGAIKVDE